MKKIKPRIPEGGAIVDSCEMTMEEYSDTMKKQLGKDYIRFSDNVVNILSPDKNSRVLEIGPGPGWAGISLLRKRQDLHLDGLEASSDMIRVATENAKNAGLIDRIRYMEGIAEEMKGILDNQYDLIISRDSMHRWIDPEKVFLQIKRVLRENGKIFIHDHRRDINLFGRLIVNIVGTLIAGKMAKYWKSSIAAAYTKGEIETILEKISCKDWTVETDLMDLIIVKK